MHLSNLVKSKRDSRGWTLLKENSTPKKWKGIKAVYRVMAVFFFALAFWIVWDQNLSEWVLQAAKMDRTINLGFINLTILAGQVQTFNPVFLSNIYTGIQLLDISICSTGWA